MSEYGIKIKNIQAGSLYDYNLGVRANLDMKDAMLTNSLFSEFLLSIGLSVWKGESTRDVICLEFDYGSRSYADEVKHLNECIKRINKDQKSRPFFTVCFFLFTKAKKCGIISVRNRKIGETNYEMPFLRTP